MNQPVKESAVLGRGSKFFGQYLLEKGRISGEQLLEAANYQKTRNAKLGTIATTMGVLTEAQVAQIHAEQRRTDKMFGDLALELKLLTQAQLDELLRVQKSRHVLFGEVLVEKGFLTPDELKYELELFNSESKMDELNLRHLLDAASKDAPLVEDALDVLSKMFRRLVHDEIKVRDFHTDRARWQPHDLSARLGFVGEFEGAFVLTLPNALALRIVQQMLGRPFSEVNELVMDALAEFANIVCGNLCSRLSLRGIESDLQPPMVAQDYRIASEDAAKKTYVVHFGTTDQQAEMTLVV